MRVRPERQVQLRLNGMTPEDVSDFSRQLQLVVNAPLEHSAFVAAREFRALRWFEFGIGVARIAVFELDHAKATIPVMECRFSRPGRRRELTKR